MKRRLLIICFLISLLSLGGCSWGNKTLDSNQYYIYGVDSDYTGLSKRVYDFDLQTSNPSIIMTYLMEQLQVSPPKSSDIPAISDNVKSVTFQIQDQGVTLYFDASYNDLKGIKEVLRRAAIVKTLTQISGIDRVEFYVDNQPLMDQSTKEAIGFMTGDDFIDNEDGSNEMKTTTVLMYFADSTGKKLVEVPTKITYDATVPLSNLLLDELIKGPEAVANLKGKKLQRTVPQDLQLNSMIIRENVCYIDLSKEFLNRVDSVTESVTVYSIVNLLVQLPNVNRVQFTIEGEPVEKFGNGMNLDGSFERNLDVVVSSEKYNKSKK